MYAILYRSNGETRLAVDERGPDAVDGEVLEATEVGADAAEAYALLTERTVGDGPVPTIDELTNAVDPWLAWYGGTDDGVYAVLYGRGDELDRKVSFRETADGYEVTLRFGTVADVGDREFDPADVPPVAVTSESTLRAKRAFHDFCEAD